jgi:nucleolar GTP-binding protein
VDPDIDSRLEQLDREEAELEAQDGGEGEEEWDSDLDEEEKDVVRQIRSSKATARREARSLRKRGKGQQLPKAVILKHRSMRQVKSELEEIGYDASKLDMPGTKRKRRDSTASGNRMDVEKDAKSRKRARGAHDPNVDDDGDVRRGTRVGEIYATASMKQKADLLKKRAQKEIKYQGMGGEADRHPGPKLVKHMIVGKRGMGKTDRR